LTLGLVEAALPWRTADLAATVIAAFHRFSAAGVARGAAEPSAALALALAGGSVVHRLAPGVSADLALRADDGGAPDADAGLAGVGLGAGVAVVARAAVRLWRVGAAAGGGVAGPRVVALVGGGAIQRDREGQAAPPAADRHRAEIRRLAGEAEREAESSPESEKRWEEPYPEALTDRKFEVLRLLAQGQSNPRIVRNLRISRGTVKVHVQYIIAKLGVFDRTQAVICAIDLGSSPPNPVSTLTYVRQIR